MASAVAEDGSRSLGETSNWRTTIGAQGLIHSVPMERIFTLPGKQWASEVGKFAEELFGAYERGNPYPIRRVFEILPVNVIEGSAADLLIRRGYLAPDTVHATLSNQGDYIDGMFGDVNLGRVGIVFTEQIQAKVAKHDAGQYRYALDFSSNPVPVALYDVPAEYDVRTNQRLHEIAFGASVVSYSLRAFEDSADAIRLDVDLTKELPAKPGTLLDKEPLDAALRNFAATASASPGLKKCKKFMIDTPCCKCCEYEFEAQDCDHPDPPKPSGPSSWYTSDAACDFGASYAAHFFRNPFWYSTPPAGFIGSQITVTCSTIGYPSTCGTGTEITGTFAMKVTQVTQNDALVYKCAIFGDKIS
jgi:hypothetical protein